MWTLSTESNVCVVTMPLVIDPKKQENWSRYEFVDQWSEDNNSVMTDAVVFDHTNSWSLPVVSGVCAYTQCVCV